MEIAVYPGSFDPPHAGHAMVASYVSQWSEAEQVWMMPSAVNPLKIESAPVVSESDRLHLCALTCQSLPGVVASDFEFSLPRPSYTYVTLKALREAFPQHIFRLVIGSDNWLIFNRWRDSDRIISEFGVIIYPRPGYPVEKSALPPEVTLLPEAPMMLVSSSFVREAIAVGKSPAGFVLPAVAAFIRDRGLYRP